MKLVFEHGMYKMETKEVEGDVTIIMSNPSGDTTTMQIFPDEVCALVGFLGVLLEVKSIPEATPLPDDGTDRTKE